jgi:hypothetical protein
MSISPDTARALIENRIVATHRYDRLDPNNQWLDDLNQVVSEWTGEGRVRDDLAATADGCGPDYICALDDGSFLAWGNEDVAQGRAFRHIVIVDQAE